MTSPIRDRKPRPAHNTIIRLKPLTRRMVCRRCGSSLIDAEPAVERGEWWHPKNDTCIHGGKCMD